jgi:hypothetical protein
MLGRKASPDVERVLLLVSTKQGTFEVGMEGQCKNQVKNNLLKYTYLLFFSYSILFVNVFTIIYSTKNILVTNEKELT